MALSFFNLTHLLDLAKCGILKATATDLHGSCREMHMFGEDAEEREMGRRGGGRVLTAFQRELLDGYFYEHNIKLTKKNLKIVSRDLKIPHKRIAEYVNAKQRRNGDDAYEEHIRMMDALEKINMGIELAWRRFRRS